MGNNSKTLIKRNKPWHRITTEFIYGVCYSDNRCLDVVEKGANQPVFQGRENVESSNKKAMPIIVSNSANTHGHGLLLLTCTGYSLMVMLKRIIVMDQ